MAQNSVMDDFFDVLNQISTLKTDGGRFYDPNYGGWLSSDNKRNMYSNNFANFMNFYTAAMTNQANLDLAKQQNAWNVEQWKRENTYNSPAEQAKRMREAGLSSAAAAMSTQPNQAQPLQSANLAIQQPPAPFSAAQFGSGSPLIQMLSGLQDIIGIARSFTGLKRDNVALKSESNELDYQIPFLASRNAIQEWTNKLQMQTFEQEAKKFPYSKRILKWQARNEKLRNQALKLANDQADWQSKLLQQQFDFLSKWNDKQLEEISEKIGNLKLEGENLQKTGKAIESSTEESRTRSALNKAQQGFVEEQTEGQKIENKIKGHEEKIAELQEILASYGSPQGEAKQIAVFMAEKKLGAEQAYDFLKGLRSFQRFGYEVLYKNHNDEEFLQQYYENYFNEGTGEQNKFGVYQQGFVKPFLRKVFRP